MSVTDIQIQKAHNELHLARFEQPSEIIFAHKHKGEMGKLKLDGEKLKFVGDVEESAKILFDYVILTLNNHIEEVKAEAVEISKQRQANPYVELVKKWLVDPKSVSQEELEANAAAARDAVVTDEADAAGYWADCAAYAADCGAGFEAANWVKKYEELTNAES